MAESNKQKKQAYIEQINLAEKLKGIVEGTNMENERAIEIAIDLDSKLQDRIKSADGIQKLDEAINELLLEQAKTKTDINQEMIDDMEGKVLELWRLAGLDASNVASITDTSITVGGVTITIGQPDSNTTTLTRS